MRIAPEGWPFVGAGWLLLLLTVAAGVVAGGWWWAIPVGWLPVALWVPWFFRDPERHGPRGEHLILAPADGRVVSVIDVEEPEYLGGPARRISVFMNVFNVHVNRHPVDGVVEHRHYRPGKFINATRDKASIDNEQLSLGVRSSRGAVLIRQIAGLIARRIVTDPSPGDAVTQGDRLGLIRFGSRVDTFLPLDARPTVRPGDHTQAGVTVIAEWGR